MTTTRLDEVFKSLEGISPTALSAAVEIKKILKSQDEKRVQPILKTVVDLSEQELSTVDEINKILQAKEDARIELILNAVRKGKINTVRYLLDKKIVDVNTVFVWSDRPMRTRTLLTVALEYPSGEAIANMLLNEYELTPGNLNCFAKNTESYTFSNLGNALQNAIEQGKMELIELLLKKGASPDIAIMESQGMAQIANSFVLYVARLRSTNIKVKQNIIELLLNYKKDQLTEKEKLAVDYVRRGIDLSKEVFEALYEVKKLIKESATKEKMELAALNAAENGYVEVLQYLFDQGIIQTNTVLHNSMASPETLLMAALRRSDLNNPVATMLLEDKKLELENIDFKDPQTGNALERAIGVRNVDCVRSLIIKGVKPVDRNGESIAQNIDKWYGPEEKREGKERRIVQMLMAYIDRYQAKQKAEQSKRAEEQAKKAADSLVDAAPPTSTSICGTLTNWFFCCRRQKAAMRYAQTNVENNEVDGIQEAKRLA